MYTVLVILALRYIDLAGHTGEKICRLCCSYWGIDMYTTLGMLVPKYEDCAGYTGA